MPESGAARCLSGVPFELPVVDSGPASAFVGAGVADAGGEPFIPLAGRAIGAVAGVPVGDVIGGCATLVAGYPVVLTADPVDGMLIVPEFSTGTDVATAFAGGLDTP
jgi:hypothetical protein